MRLPLDRGSSSRIEEPENGREGLVKLGCVADSRGLLNMTMMLAAVVVLSILGLAFYFRLEWFENLVLYWRTPN
jgi:ABC-type nitrate/sulfonate/bicarbonate transport system permease component